MEENIVKKESRTRTSLVLIAVLIGIVLILLLAYFPKKQHISVNGKIGDKCSSMQADITIWQSVLLPDHARGKEFTVIWNGTEPAVTYSAADSLYLKMKDKTQLITMAFYDAENNVCGHVTYCWNEKTGFSELESYRIGGEAEEE